LLEYPTLFASARQGWTTLNLADIPGKQGVVPLLDTIIKHFPCPNDATALLEPFALSVNTIGMDSHLGRIVTGKVEAGSVRVGDRIKVLDRDGAQQGQECKVAVAVAKLLFMLLPLVHVVTTGACCIACVCFLCGVM